MTGNEAIAKILKAEGLDWFACFPHHTLIDAAAKEGLRPIPLAPRAGGCEHGGRVQSYHVR